MFETFQLRKQDLWTVEADWIAVPTNAMLKGNGEAVMGAGVAKAAAERFPALPRVLAHKLRTHGLYVEQLGTYTHDIAPNGTVEVLAFPTKYHWRHKAELELIERSLIELVYLWAHAGEPTVVLPFPGIGNGKLGRCDVMPLLRKHLRSEKFIVVEKPEDKSDE